MIFNPEEHHVSDGLEHFIDVLCAIRDDPEVLRAVEADPQVLPKGVKKKTYKLAKFAPYCNNVLFEYFILGNEDNGTYQLNKRSVAALASVGIPVIQRNNCVYFDLGKFII